MGGWGGGRREDDGEEGGDGGVEGGGERRGICECNKKVDEEKAVEEGGAWEEPRGASLPDAHRPWCRDH